MKTKTLTIAIFLTASTLFGQVINSEQLLIDSPIECNNLQITFETYSETDDLIAAIQGEFGSNYTIADWNDLEAIADLDEWISCMELADGQHFMITKDGEYLYGSIRQYFIGYFTGGSAPSNWLVHANIDNRLFLGSWYGIEINILAKNVCSSAICISELSNKSACKNDSITFEVNAIGEYPISYQWQKNGVNISGASDSVLIIPNVLPEDEGEYCCIATNDYGSDTSNAALLTIEFAITTNIIGPANVIEYQVVLYSVAMQEGHTYEFLAEGGNLIDVTENTITVHWGKAGQGFVKLVETSELACYADTNTLNVTIGNLGIDDIKIQNLSVYPNPFTSSMTIEYTLKHPSYIQIIIYNHFGQQIDIIYKNHSKGIQLVVWNAKGLPPGLYFIHIQIGDQRATKKVVKIK